MIIFVGSNPSNASKNLVPFTLDTVSGRVLQSWITAAGIFEHSQCNVANMMTKDNRPLSQKEIRRAIPQLQKSLANYTKVVALGKTAQRALELANIPHLFMPHPSGMNRQLNDRQFVEACIQKLRDYVKT